MSGLWQAYLDLGPLARMACLVGGVLAGASLAVGALRAVRPARAPRELVLRLRSWWVMATMFFAAVVVNEKVSVVFFGLLSFWALKEYVTLLATRPADHGALALTFLAVPLQFFWVGIEWYGMFLVFIPVYMFLALPIRMVMAQETRGFVAAVGQIHWGLMAFVFGLSHLAFLLTLELGDGVNGRTLLLFLVFLAEMNDVFQFLWGRAVGRLKVLPAVSPNKTWEGLVGGVTTTILVSPLLRFLTPFGWDECLFVAGLVALVGFFGDVVLSAVKRDFGVKDFGELIPGHGGVLDRVDSLCFAAPVFLHYVRYFHG